MPDNPFKPSPQEKPSLLLPGFEVVEVPGSASSEVPRPVASPERPPSALPEDKMGQLSLF